MNVGDKVRITGTSITATLVRPVKRRRSPTWRIRVDDPEAIPFLVDNPCLSERFLEPLAHDALEVPWTS